MKLVAIFAALLTILSLGFAQGKPVTSNPDQHKMMVQYDKEQRAAKAAFAKAPKNAAAKKKYVDATVRMGTFCMETPVLDRKVKYVRALHYYREALKLDPKNVEAKSNSDMIISIYKQMGRPIPKDGI